MRNGRQDSRDATVGVIPVLLLVAFVCVAGVQAPPNAHSPDQDDFRISVDVALVVLHATVTDSQGGFASNLKEQDFEIYEDGVRQHIQLCANEDVPVTVALVVDHSSTMLPKLEDVIIAARTFVRASNRADEMFVVNFNERVSLGLPGAMHFTSNAAELSAAIGAPVGGQTALFDAIARGLDGLRSGSRDKRVLILISDGGDNRSTQTLSEVMKLAAQSTAVIYTVGIFDENDPDKNPGVLRRLAHATGGEAFLPDKASEVVAICERIARDIRHQYTLGYIPTNQARNGAYRAIRIHAGTKDNNRLSVRTRTGYIAARQPDSKEKEVKP